MTVGLIGTGNMGRAFALGLGESIVCFDPLAERASALAAETGGEALASNREVAERADLVVLAHKPGQLEEVAGEIAGVAKAVLSILGGRTLDDLERALGKTPVSRAMPNIAVELQRGVLCYARGSRVDDDLDARLRELLSRLGVVLDVPDALLDPATGVTGVAPAYMAVIVEAWIDSAVHHGIPMDLAAPMVIESAAGAIELLRAREGETLGVRRAVTSPGGVTAAGLGALERAGVRGAFVDAMDAVMERFRS
jgi:pyrroline-5-carboxylate reductase